MTLKRFVLVAVLAVLCFTFPTVRLMKRHKTKRYETIVVDKKNLEQKKAKGIPSWMEAQIHEDLSFYAPSGISSKMLDALSSPATIKKYQLVRFKIIDRQLSYETTLKTKNWKAFHQTYAFLKALNEALVLPNVDFWVSIMSDGLECAPEKSPIFVYAKNKKNVGQILIPDFKMLCGYGNLRKMISQGNERYAWEEKQSQLFWRGAATGGVYNWENWERYPRSKLVSLSRKYPEKLDARFVSLGQCDPTLRRYFINQGMACKPVEKMDHLKYKYLIDLDGNTCGYERCYWQLLSNSVMLKQNSDNIQWYYQALRPWQHYVPVDRDLSDLFEKLEWVRRHDQEAQQIANRATQFVEENLFPEDAVLYVYELLCHYAQLFSDGNAPTSAYR